MLNSFNTGIVFEGTLFHIQTEAGKESGIETAVYVKAAVLFPAETLQPDFTHASAGSGQEFTKLLEEQRRQVIERIRVGEVKPPRAPASDLGTLKE